MADIAFRCDADPSIGYGHLQRCIGLAKVLVNEFSHRVIFYVVKSDEAINLLNLNRLDYVLLQNSDFSTFSDFLIQSPTNVLVVDERRYLNVSNINFFKNKKIKTVLIDDLSDKRLAADHVFYPPISQYSKLSWEKFLGQSYSGWDWVLLKPEYANLVERVIGKEKHILVTLGGADYWELTENLIIWLDQINEEFEIDLVITKAFRNYDSLKDTLIKTSFRHKLNVFSDLQSIRSLMIQANFAIATFGVTAYELAATGIASILLCPTADHYESAKIFEIEKISTIHNIMNYLPIREDSFFKTKFMENVLFYLRNEKLIMEMGLKAKSICRGDGAYNIARKIQEFC